MNTNRGLQALVEPPGERAVMASDTEGAEAIQYVRVVGPSYQQPLPPDVPVNVVGTSTLVTAGNTNTLLTFSVPGDRQFRASGLACVVDDAGMAGVMQFTVNVQGNPLQGFNHTFPMGSLFDPAPVWLNVLGPASITVTATNVGFAGSAVTVNARLVGWLYAEVAK